MTLKNEEDEKTSIKIAHAAKIDEVEYAQLSLDWRHRDAMSWATLTLSITATVMAIKLNHPLIWFLVGIFHCLLLIKLIKDDLYKMGSSELMNEMRKRCGHEHCECLDSKHLTPRKFNPSKEYIIICFEKRWKLIEPIYTLLSRVPTFETFFSIQIISILGAMYGVCGYFLSGRNSCPYGF